MRTLVIADVHANLAALQAVLDVEQSWDRCLFPGDAVLAGPGVDGFWPSRRAEAQEIT